MADQFAQDPDSRAEFEAWAKQAGWPHSWGYSNTNKIGFCSASWNVWQAAAQRQQERIEELDALVKYLQQEVARVERNRDMWRSQCQHQANALASIRLERDAAIARATHKEKA